MSLPRPHGHDPQERLSAEELRTVRGAGLFDTYLGKGWVRSTIIYGFPAISALLIAAGIFSSFIVVSDTLLIYAQPSWVPGSRAGARIAVMDEDGEFVPITELTLVMRDRDADRRAVLFDGPAHGTRAASLSVDVPSWPSGSYELEVRSRTTRSTKKAVLPVKLDTGYGGEKPVTTRVLSAWKKQYQDEDFMQPGSPIEVEIFAEGGQVASSLPNILYVRTTSRDGEPLSATVDLTLEEGYISGELTPRVTTDALGLATVIVYPTFNVLVMGVTAMLDPPADALPAPTGPQDAPGDEPPVPAGEGGLELVASPGAVEAPDLPAASRGSIVLPIGPQGIRLRAMVPDPVVGAPIRLRVYSVGHDTNVFTDLYREGVWIAATDTPVDGQSSEVAAPAARVPGLHVVQAYSSPVPALFTRLPGLEPQLTSATLSAGHVWVRAEHESPEQIIVSLASELIRRGIDAPYTGHLTTERLSRGDFNSGQTIAFLLSRLDGSLYPPDVASSSREHDKRSALGLQRTIRTLVIVALCVVGFVIMVAAGLLVTLTVRASRMAPPDQAGPETPIQSHDSQWLRKQVFSMAMIIAVFVGMIGLLTVLVAYLRWQIG